MLQSSGRPNLAIHVGNRPPKLCSHRRSDAWIGTARGGTSGDRPLPWPHCFLHGATAADHGQTTVSRAGGLWRDAPCRWAGSRGFLCPFPNGPDSGLEPVPHRGPVEETTSRTRVQTLEIDLRELSVVETADLEGGGHLPRKGGPGRHGAEPLATTPADGPHAHLRRRPRRARWVRDRDPGRVAHARRVLGHHGDGVPAGQPVPAAAARRAAGRPAHAGEVRGLERRPGRRRRRADVGDGPAHPVRRLRRRGAARPHSSSARRVLGDPLGAPHRDGCGTAPSSSGRERSRRSSSGRSTSTPSTALPSRDTSTSTPHAGRSRRRVETPRLCCGAAPDCCGGNRAGVLVVAFGHYRESGLMDVVRRHRLGFVSMFVIPRLFEVGRAPRCRTTSARSRAAPPSGRDVRAEMAASSARSTSREPARDRRAVARAGALALAVRWEGGRGVIFRQVRVGRDGREFEVFKFRSMRPADPGESDVQWSIAKDSRVGNVGRFIRKTSLDELPQLFNILRGDMTFVAPDPSGRTSSRSSARTSRTTAPAPRSRRAHRAGPGQRPARRHLHRRPGPVRQLLHRELEPLARREGDPPDRPPRPQPSGS